MILFTGKGTSGSWKIRGEQLGKACGAVVKPKATLSDCKKADVIVVVKRMTPELSENIKRSKTPWVWDVVDFYPQPECSQWCMSKSIKWVKSQIRRHNPTAVIWPNKRMGDDCGIKGTVIYHHHWPEIEANPIRPEVKVVGYEGSPNYLAEWFAPITKECRERGWEFRVNSGKHKDFDICLAFRGMAFNGYAQHHWKSNVKLANCHGSGTPFIGPRESGYVETASGEERWVDSHYALQDAFDELASKAVRDDIHARFIKNAITVDDCARQMLDLLRSV